VSLKLCNHNVHIRNVTEYTTRASHHIRVYVDMLLDSMTLGIVNISVFL